MGSKIDYDGLFEHRRQDCRARSLSLGKKAEFNSNGCGHGWDRNDGCTQREVSL